MTPRNMKKIRWQSCVFLFLQIPFALIAIIFSLMMVYQLFFSNAVIEQKDVDDMFGFLRRTLPIMLSENGMRIAEPAIGALSNTLDILHNVAENESNESLIVILVNPSFMSQIKKVSACFIISYGLFLNYIFSAATYYCITYARFLSPKRIQRNSFVGGADFKKAAIDYRYEDDHMSKFIRKQIFFGKENAD